MSDSPPAPRLATPSWLDTRLVLGLLLVLVSVVVGARVLASADESTRVWGLTRDLAPGATLSREDLEPVRVRLLDAQDAYLPAPAGREAPTGYVLTRRLGAGELLPRAALQDPGRQVQELRDVSVPVDAGHLPSDLAPGELVDVYVTRSVRGAATPPPTAGPTALVLRELAVLRRSGADRGADAEAVVLSVPVADAAEVVAALRGGSVDLVRVPSPGAP